MEIRARLQTDLQWLTKAYGKCSKQKLQDRGKNQIIYPAIYVGGIDYLDMRPNEKLGNYTFFDVKDGQKVDRLDGTQEYDTVAEIGLVAWFKYESIYGANHERNTVENVADEIHNSMMKLGLRYGRLEPLGLYEHPENVYKGFSHREIEDRYNMRPFGCLRINMLLYYDGQGKCSEGNLQPLIEALT